MDEAVLLSMAQTIGIQLRPEVVRKLMPDAEYALREVICAAKSFMRHAKRNRLVQDDVTMATKLYDSVLSRRNKSERFLMVNNRTRYPVSNIKNLAELYKSELPRHQNEVALHCSWLEENVSKDDGQSLSKMTERETDEQSWLQMGHQNGGKEEESDKGQARQKIVEEVVTDVIGLVNTHIAPTGRTEAVAGTVEAVWTLLTQELYEIEKHRDDILRCGLTCILGRYPKMETEAIWEARRRVIEGLGQWKDGTTDMVAVGRVCKTLFAGILDYSTPLDGVCAGITAIVALGEIFCVRYLVPHVPALLHSLEHRLGESINTGEEDVKWTVDGICEVLSKTLDRITRLS